VAIHILKLNQPAGPIWLAEIFCDGTEGNLEWCKHGPWGNTKQCDHSMDAGVCCQGKGKPPPKKASSIAAVKQQYSSSKAAGKGKPPKN
jgi:hypothetical protein